MIVRRLENQVLTALKRVPAVVLLGPRQIGKTTLAYAVAEKLPSVHMDLENLTDLQKIQDVASFHFENRDNLIILDEVQRKPEIFSELRSIIDAERRRGHKTGLFLFLGSASLDLLKQSSESLAGRITTMELFPIDVLEYESFTLDHLNNLWLRGGFPESLLADSDADSLAWRRDFTRTYIERDVPFFGPKIPAETLTRFWTMLANIQGGILNASQFAKTLDVSQPTIKRYLDLLVDLLLVRQLQPWSGNLNKRLVRSPKIYIRDSGITHSLLNIKSFNDLLGHPVQGGSWEGFVIENIMSVLPQHINTYFYRSQAGAEIDLILELSVKEKWVIEIKRSTIPTVTKGFHIAAEDVGATHKYVIHAGGESFSIGSGVQAISLPAMMERVLKL
jgi:uncharacterized protein